MMILDLYPYQEPAVDLFLERGSLLVAFEMGLGKTAIALAAAEELLGCGDISTVLLVVPASLRLQWAQALVKFTDVPSTSKKVKGSRIQVPRSSHAVVVPSGPKKLRRKALEAAAHNRVDYIIASYETVLSETRHIKRLSPGLVVLDEASAIGHFEAGRTLTAKRSLTAEYRMALTGTPVENRAEEAFSIMEWVDSSVLGPFDLFEKAFIDRWPNGTVKKIKNVRLLNEKLSHGMVRRSRTDPDVRKYLPEADHDVWHVDLDKPTREAYDLLADDLLSELLKMRGAGGFDLAAYYSGTKQGEGTAVGRVMSRHQAIELLLDHPDLLVDSAVKYEKSEGDGPGSKYCYQVWQEGLVDELRHSVKLNLLVAKMEEILAFEENKVLIFSQHPQMLSIIQDHLDVACVQYHGGLSTAAKAAAIARFQSEPDVRVFLSSHAGAYGTDMYMANYLINYDLPWSAGKADQINGRHQRASSEFSHVYIRDIILRGTIEERKLAVVEHKRKIAAAVVDGRAPASGRIENDLASLTNWLQGS
jgi:SNF2 family DNA or RNA helicase